MNDLNQLLSNIVFKEKVIHILGFQKCGQNSLYNIFEKIYPDKIIHKQELITKVNGKELYERYKTESVPVAIVRNRVEAIWSRYYYFGNYLVQSINEYLMTKDLEWSPLYQTDFDLHLNRWYEYGLFIARLEDLSNTEKFPHVNKNHAKDYRRPNKEEINVIKEACAAYEENKYNWFNSDWFKKEVENYGGNSNFNISWNNL